MATRAALRSQGKIFGLLACGALQSICQKLYLLSQVTTNTSTAVDGQLPNTSAEIEEPAFACTAIDMFGPIQIRLSRKTLKEAQIITFACMTSRAIQLELVTDLTTDAFLLAFRRFACTRGHPALGWSDLGTKFVGAQQCLKEICKQENITRIQNTVAEDFNCQFRWELNIPKQAT